MVAMGSGEFLRRAELEDEWSNTHVFVSRGRRWLCLRAPPVFSKVITTREAALPQPRILDTDLTKDLKLSVLAAAAPPKGHKLIAHAQNVLLW